MMPFKTIIILDRKSKQALYIQLTNQFIALIKKGTLLPKAKLPSSRVLSELIGLHRKTVVACYEELTLQGWVESIPQRGTFVHSHIPLLQQEKLVENTKRINKDVTGFSFKKDERLSRKFSSAL